MFYIWAPAIVSNHHMHNSHVTRQQADIASHTRHAAPIPDISVQIEHESIWLLKCPKSIDVGLVTMLKQFFITKYVENVRDIFGGVTRDTD